MWQHHRDEYGMELSEDRLLRYRAPVAATGLADVPPEEVAAEPREIRRVVAVPRTEPARHELRVLPGVRHR